ncbi:MAG: PDZ domain-containing protein [Acidobacteria bacterium]|nr:PDZ domain-containing protein [Acidobacteriota bacterium]MYG74268.1 PDZ domain-containing protein [Acidobacteriota bacterium]
MFRFLPAALALAGLVAAPGCLTESADFRSLAAAVTDAQDQGVSDQEGARRQPGHERLADIPAPQDTPDRTRTEAAWTLSDAFAEVARVATPGVVSLLVERESARGAEDPRLEQFFGFPPAPSPPGAQFGRGSGAIVDPSGLIVTNNHVVDGATRIEVEFSDGRTLEAVVVGQDPPTDLAVIRLETDGEVFPHLALGNSDEVRVGDWVLAIGNPLGNSHSVTAGIVSAKGRVLQGDYQDFIQTDAAINRGNSGGPLVGLDGSLVGVNTMIQVAGTPGNIGLGFAIPSNLVRRVYDDLASEGQVTRGWLGVAVVPLDPRRARAFGLAADARGAQIDDFSGPDSPAAAAGLERGDIIVRFNGRPIEDSMDLQFAVADARPDQPSTVEVLRGGVEISVDVVLGQRDFRQAAPLADAAPPEPEPPVESPGRLGLVGETLEGADFEGVLVRQVVPGGIAHEAGIEPGHVITRIGGRPVGTAGDLRDALSGIAAGEPFPIQIARQVAPGEWRRNFVIVEAPE